MFARRPKVENVLRISSGQDKTKCARFRAANTRHYSNFTLNSRSTNGRAMTKYELKEKIIGYVDILGFSQHMRAAEAGRGFTPDELFDAAKHLGTIHSRDEFERYGPLTCPHSVPLNRNLDYEVSQAFDCVILSAEPSASGAVNLIGHCWSAAMHLLTKGLLCRGYVTRGRIYHRGSDVFGSGHLDVMDKEKSVSFFKKDADERGTPYVEIDKAIVMLVENEGDDCLKKMFNRFVKRDGELAAVFPFAALGHSYIVAAPGYTLDPSAELQSNNNMRNAIRHMKSKIEALTDPTDRKASQKAAHYIAALEAQLLKCDRADERIAMWAELGFGSKSESTGRRYFTASPRPAKS